MRKDNIMKWKACYYELTCFMTVRVERRERERERERERNKERDK